MTEETIKALAEDYASPLVWINKLEKNPTAQQMEFHEHIATEAFIAGYKAALSSTESRGNDFEPEASNTDEAAVASHSCTVGNSIEQFLRMKIDAAHRNWDKAQKTNKRLYFSAKLKAFHEVLDHLINQVEKVEAKGETNIH